MPRGDVPETARRRGGGARSGGSAGNAQRHAAAAEAVIGRMMPEVCRAVDCGRPVGGCGGARRVDARRRSVMARLACAWPGDAVSCFRRRRGGMGSRMTAWSQCLRHKILLDHAVAKCTALSSTYCGIDLRILGQIKVI